jgi:hypothetical protein
MGQAVAAFPNQAPTKNILLTDLVSRYLQSQRAWTILLGITGLCGIIFAIKMPFTQKEIQILLLVTVAYFALLPCILNVPEDRFRLPFEGILALWSVLGVSSVWARFSRK